mmetsp:Transcript_6870/g.20569  ORF Transcript_6870/g.20569 Transcript_6870/m.20569 type:complete len:394 (+) Transcript_6870:134-1315(+)
MAVPHRIVVLKLGGSSITVKSSFETLDDDMLDRVSIAVAETVDGRYRSSSTPSPSASAEGKETKDKPNANEVEDVESTDGGEGSGSKRRRSGEGDEGIREREAPARYAGTGGGGGPAFVIVHGAGSFGHHTAREYGLRGHSSPPSPSDAINGDASTEDSAEEKERRRRRAMTGLCRTRLSVTKLNRAVVSSLVSRGVNAAGISPGVTLPGLHAHGGNENGGMDLLAGAAADALRAGLVPVVHGDAALYGTHGAGILGGDTLVEGLATRIGAAMAEGSASRSIGKAKEFVVEAVFLTDVDGVFTSDPNLNPNASLLPEILIDGETGRVLAENLDAGRSTHEHDVTGGLETKLGAAAEVARNGVEVRIVKCGSDDAVRCMKGEEGARGTIVRLAS